MQKSEKRELNRDARTDAVMTRWIGQQLGLRRKRLFIVVAMLVVSSMLGTPVMAQSAGAQAPPTQPPAPMPEWQRTAGGKMEFEVAAVRQSKPEVPFEANITLDALDGTAPTSDSFKANAPLIVYIIFAYKIADIEQHHALYAQLPMWAQTDRYNIAARAEGTPTRDQFRLMMQSLLRDRFKLTVHTESRPRAVYALVLDKPGKLGPHLHPHPRDKPCTDNPSHSPMIAAPAKDVEPPFYCGFTSWPINDQVHLRMIDTTMKEIADYLSGLSRPGGVESHSGLDRTGLDGRFDLDLEFTPNFHNAGIYSDAPDPEFTRELRDQLGLKLVEQKNVVNVFIIDHIEKLSKN